MDLRMLAFAVATKRAAFVVIDRHELVDWGVSVKAAESAAEITAWANSVIEATTPEVVITERLDGSCRKGENTRALITVVSSLAATHAVLDIAVSRPHGHPSKYEEAADLAERYPALLGWLPRKRRAMDNETRNTVLFEAVALAEKVRLSSATSLGAELG